MRGRRKKVHLKRHLPQLTTQRSFPRYFGKVLVMDAYLKKFSRFLIENNELVCNNDEQVPNNDGLVPNDKMASA